MNWSSNFQSSNRTWNGRIGEMIVFTDMLSRDEEAAVLAYLRAKWLGKGDGPAEPPSFLSGNYATPTFDGTGLELCDGTALEQCGPTCALANLIVGDDVMFVRDWAGEPAGFALFDIAGGMAFGMRPSLTVSVKPAETVKVFGGEFAGNLSGWTLDGGKMGNARMIKRADGIYLSVGGGTVFLLL